MGDRPETGPDEAQLEYPGEKEPRGKRPKRFSWRSLLRVIKATMLDDIETVAGMRNYLSIVLWVCISTGHQVRRSELMLRQDTTAMSSTYFILRECMLALAEALRMFPANSLQVILDLLEDVMIGLGGAVQTFEGRPG